LEWSAKQPDVVFFEDSGVSKLYCQIEARLASERGQYAVGLFSGDDSFQDFHRQRFDVHEIGDSLIGHDGGGIGIHQNGCDSLLTEGFARLRSGVIELGGLSDYYGTGAYDQDF
jgi:hypothetical protein